MTGASDGSLLAHCCPNDHWTIPGHHRCPTCGDPQVDTVDVSDDVGEVLTWTESTATPPGVRSPNTVAIVEFDVDGTAVRTIGGVEGSVDRGDAVKPVFVPELRDPDAGIREPTSQSWEGYRFEPV